LEKTRDTRNEKNFRVDQTFLHSFRHLVVACYIHFAMENVETEVADRNAVHFNFEVPQSVHFIDAIFCSLSVTNFQINRK